MAIIKVFIDEETNSELKCYLNSSGNLCFQISDNISEETIVMSLYPEEANELIEQIKFELGKLGDD